MLLLTVLLAFAASSAISLTAQSDSPEDMFHKAEAASKAGDLQSAIDLYSKLVRQHSELVAPHVNLGVALAHKGRMDEAAAQYKEALQLEPGNSAIQIDLAILDYKRAHYEEAIAVLQPIVKAQPVKGQPFFLLADCYMRLGRFNEVIELLNPVYVQDPSDRTLSYLLGRALLAEGDTQRGAQVIDRVFRDGDSGEAELLIGARLLAVGDFHGATPPLRKAMSLDPKLPGGWSLLGRALLDDGDFAGARDAFHRALEADPNDFDANLYLGGMLRHDGQFDAAMPYLEKALQIRPDSPLAGYQMGALQFSRGDFEKALQYLEPVASKWPDFQQVHVQLAMVYQRLHRFEESKRERDIVLSLDDKDRQSRKLVPHEEPINQ